MRPAGYGRAQQIWGAVLTSVPQVPGALVAWSSAPAPAGGAGITSAAAKRELRRAAFDAFVTPLGPEDLCTLSREIDWILDHAKGATRRVRGHGCPSDAGRPRYLGIVLGRQKLYRPCSRMGKTAVDVSERLVHAIFKEH
jgi:hypothetical protein